MPATLGILFAFGALLGWGVGDFFLQKTVRAVGLWRTLFCIGAAGSLLLAPFAWRDLPLLFSSPSHRWLFLLAGLIVCGSAPVNFIAFQRGKIAVVTPTIALELPLVVLLGLTVGGERPRPAQLSLILLVFAGIALAASLRRTRHAGVRLEAGTMWAILGAVGLASGNFMVGRLSQATSPVLAVWYTYTVLATLSLGYLLATKQLAGVAAALTPHRRAVLPFVVCDVAAWVCYAFATTLIPIAVAITISEGYVALAVILGVTVNRERLTPRQGVGVALAALGVIGLAAATGGG